MTDREKLQKAIDILEEDIHNSHWLYLQTTDFQKGYIEAYHNLCRSRNKDNSSVEIPAKYQPTSRPCFDKPAGVPILHGETVE